MPAPAESTMATAIVSPRARPRPSMTRGDHAGAGVGEDRQPDHLPPRGAERERGLLVQPRRLGEDLARDRGDDRQDHDRQHDAGGEDGACRSPTPGRRRTGASRGGRRARRGPASARARAPRCPRGRRPRWGPRRAGRSRRRSGRRAAAARSGRQQRDADRERNGDDQRDDGGQDGAEEQRADVAPEVRRLGRRTRRAGAGRGRPRWRGR